MPAPRVFVSSTFYDLRYIRENLKFFVKSLGYEPVLSEEGGIYYDPESHVQEAAVAEVPSCQMLVLIIGGRYGQRFKPDPKQSVTNAEYKKAIETKVPIFALVEREVYEQYRVYRENIDNSDVDAASINYPAVDSVKIFDFIEEVQGQSVNNALAPFGDFDGIQQYLRQQWASMMFSHLASGSEANRVAGTLSAVTEINEKVEFLTREVLRSVGDPAARAAVDMYDALLASDIVSDLARGKARPTPEAILKNETLKQYFEAAGMRVEVKGSSSGATWSVDMIRFSRNIFDSTTRKYDDLRNALVDKLGNYGLSVEDFLKSRSGGEAK